MKRTFIAIGRCLKAHLPKATRTVSTPEVRRGLGFGRELSFGGRPDFPKGVAKCSAVLLAVFCLVVAGFPVGATAHEPAPSSYTVQGTEIIGYRNGERIAPFTEAYIDKVTVRLPKYKKVRVAPFSKKVPVYKDKITVKCQALIYGDPNSRICWPVTVRVVSHYNTVPVYKYENVRDGWGEPFEVPVTKTRPVYNYEKIPIYNTVTKYRCPDADHSLSGDKCVHPKTTTTSSGDDKQCPVGTEKHTDTQGDTTTIRCVAPARDCKDGEYPYPVRIWIQDTRDGPMHITEEQVTENPSLAQTATHARWEPAGNCFKPVMSGGRELQDYYPSTPKGGFKGFWNDFVQVIKDSWKDGESEVMAVVRAFDDYLCQDYLWTGGLTTGSAATSEGARRVSNVRLAAQTAGAARYLTITGVAVLGACITIDATNATEDINTNADDTDSPHDDGNSDTQTDEGDSDTDDSGTGEKSVEPVSLSVSSVSCVKSGSKWVVSVSWETGEGLRTSVAVSEVREGGHYADKPGVGESSETFDVPRWGTYTVLVLVRAEDQGLLRDRTSVSCPY